MQNTGDERGKNIGLEIKSDVPKGDGVQTHGRSSAFCLFGIKTCGLGQAFKFFFLNINQHLLDVKFKRGRNGVERFGEIKFKRRAVRFAASVKPPIGNNQVGINLRSFDRILSFKRRGI